MKKLLKILGILILIVVLVVGGFAAFIAIRGIPKYEVNVPDIPKVEITPERVARGEKITSMLCRSCHYSSETGKLSGMEITDAPAFGKLYSSASSASWSAPRSRKKRTEGGVHGTPLRPYPRSPGPPEGGRYICRLRVGDDL